MSGAKKGQKSENRKHKEQKEKWHRYVCVCFFKENKDQKRENCSPLLIHKESNKKNSELSTTNKQK